MKLYRFSPITSESELMDAIRYVHKACQELCFEVVGQNLPVSGNLGIFCHYYDEYEYLSSLREKLTYAEPNYNGKYFQLKEPIVIEQEGNIPSARYGYLYIRQVDPYRSQVGDVDFVLPAAEHDAFKSALKISEFQNDARLFDRPDEDMIELWKPAYDVVSFIVKDSIEARIRQNG